MHLNEVKSRKLKGRRRFLLRLQHIAMFPSGSSRSKGHLLVSAGKRLSSVKAVSEARTTLRLSLKAKAERDSQGSNCIPNSIELCVKMPAWPGLCKEGHDKPKPSRSDRRHDALPHKVRNALKMLGSHFIFSHHWLGSLLQLRLSRAPLCDLWTSSAQIMARNAQRGRFMICRPLSPPCSLRAADVPPDLQLLYLARCSASSAGVH